MAQEQNSPMSNALHSGAPQEGQQNVMGQADTQPTGQPNFAPQSPTPELSHEQAQAAVIHFSKLEQTLAKLMADPEVGKKNMRPEVLEAAANLLGEGFTTLPEIMPELATLPTDPSEQFKWIKSHRDGAEQALLQVFRDYTAQNPAGGDWKAQAAQRPMYDKNNHTSLMSGVMAHYRSRQQRARS